MKLVAGATDSKLAFVFPGQGSQFVGMGKCLYDESPAARQVFEEADEALGLHLTKLIFEGTEHELQDTINAQPAILTASIAALAALNERWGDHHHLIRPRAVAGHSLGEYTALVAAGALDFPDAVRLVRERGRLMKEAGTQTPGGMAAVIGLDDEVLARICALAAAKGIVSPANYNSPGQTVISGEITALAEAMQLAIAEGARKVVRLAVSIASHSPLMRAASEQLENAIQVVGLRDAQIPIIANITAQVITSAEEIRRELVEQVCASVRWTQTVASLATSGATTIVEVGPGQVLTGLTKRANRGGTTLSVGRFAEVVRYPALVGEADSRPSTP